MDSSRVERRLSAILAADIVGYSRLVEADEAGTLDAIKTIRSEVIEPLLDEHSGRTVKLMGDGAIVEFGSVVDAVACAVAVQRDVAASQIAVPPERRVVFRIGINLGDVVVDGDDLLGDGVNVAARLEQLCDPGGVLVSGAAYDQLQGKLGLPLDFTGEQQVKNIARPVRTYRVRLDGSRRNLRLHARRLRKWAAPAAATLVLLVIGLMVWLRPWEPSVEAASIHRMALALPDKPSIAVLPFNNLGGDPEQTYFADGITEDLITDLSKISGIFVIARNSSWTYKDKPTKPQQVAEDLGIQYVLEGSVRREGDEVRINAQLIDAIGGHHLWAERYDGSLSDVFALQDQVIGQIVAALAVKLTREEQHAATKAETESPQAYDALLEGLDHLRRDNEENTLKAAALFEKAVQIDPNYDRAYAALAAANLRIVLSLWGSTAGSGWAQAWGRLEDSLAKAMKNPTPLAYAVHSQVLAQQGRYDEAFDEINRAMALAPNDPDNHITKARLLSATGRAPEGEAAARYAMRLDPQFSPGYLRVLALALFHQERYEDSVETLNRVVSRQSDVAEDYATLASSYGHLGKSDKFPVVVESYNQIAVPAGFDPLTVQEMAWWWYGDVFGYYRPYIEQLQQGLRKAGVPEGAGTDLARNDYVRFLFKMRGVYDVRGAKKIDAAEAKVLLDRGVTFVDVRAPVDFNGGHIPGSKNLSLVTDLSKDSLSSIGERDTEIVFGCHGLHCPYSAYASAKALAWGFTRVYYFAGGFPAWQAAGYPVEITPTQ